MSMWKLVEDAIRQYERIYHLELELTAARTHLDSLVEKMTESQKDVFEKAKALVRMDELRKEGQSE